MIDLPASIQQIKAGKLVAYAVTNAQRLPMLPDVATIAEAGVPGYESVGWFGIVAPAGTPQPIVNKLNTALTAATGDPQVRTAMQNLGAQLAPTSPKAFEDYVAAETRKWAKVVKTANIKPE
jgi:tripartite-type tricarboxylate transporter receptor subunit TctC